MSCNVRNRILNNWKLLRSSLLRLLNINKKIDIGSEGCEITFPKLYHYNFHACIKLSFHVNSKPSVLKKSDACNKMLYNPSEILACNSETSTSHQTLQNIVPRAVIHTYIDIVAWKNIVVSLTHDELIINA